MVTKQSRVRVDWPVDFPEEARKTLQSNIDHCRKVIYNTRRRKQNTKVAQKSLDFAILAREAAIADFYSKRTVNEVNTHTTTIVQKDGEKTRAEIKKLTSIAAGTCTLADFDENDPEAELDARMASRTLNNTRMAHLRKVIAKKAIPSSSSSSSVAQVVEPPKKRTQNSKPVVEGPPRKRTRNTKVSQPARATSFDGLELRGTLEEPKKMQVGPNFDGFSVDIQESINSNFKLHVLPSDLLQDVHDYVNSIMANFKVHKQARKQNELTERPKLVFAVPHPEHGGLGLYTWGQEMADYGRVDSAPDVIVRLIDFMSQVYDEEFNHCMLTLHVDGTCGIPPHPDKSFSKESKGKNETSSKIADISLGATRAFMLVTNNTEGNVTTNEMMEHCVARLDMTHGSSLCMQADWNTKVKHCVPLDPSVTEPRVSMVFRRVDKRFIHPTENQIRDFSDADWKPLVNSKKEPVTLRRQ